MGLAGFEVEVQRETASGIVTEDMTLSMGPQHPSTHGVLRFVVRADLPGVEAKDIDVTAENGVLTLRGERRAEQRPARGGFERTERTFGTFLRRFALPDNVQADAIAAKHVNGVLEISVPKQPKIEPKRITIEAA